uniref:PH domain-containing protein n=1 Tax=Hyaloperonospora arabidopsidis (strain Emoy2) TaxID=559515 RepID=M4BH05_HYAAE
MIRSFPTLSHRHPRVQRTTFYPSKARPHPSAPTSLESLNEPFLSSPRHKSSRSESLRSTWMTNDSDSIGGDYYNDEEEEYSEKEVVDSEVTPACPQELTVVVPLQAQPLSDWVYWQRDAVALPNCWTRVFAVFCGTELWLYRYEDASARSLLLRIRVTALDVGPENTRQLQFQDGMTTTTVKVHLCFLDTLSFTRWQSHVATEIAKLSVLRQEGNHVVVLSTVASALQKPSSLWKVVMTSIRIKPQTVAGQADPAFVLASQKRLKSLGQRWKQVTTALKSALKPNQGHIHRLPQLDG